MRPYGFGRMGSEGSCPHTMALHNTSESKSEDLPRTSPQEHILIMLLVCVQIILWFHGFRPASRSGHSSPCQQVRRLHGLSLRVARDV